MEVFDSPGGFAESILGQLMLKLSDEIQAYMRSHHRTPEGDAVVDAALGVWEATLDVLVEYGLMEEVY